MIHLEKKMKTKADFELAVTAYTEKEFGRAIEAFKVVQQKNAKDTATTIYIERCERYIKDGVPEDWDGVEKFEHK